MKIQVYGKNSEQALKIITDLKLKYRVHQHFPVPSLPGSDQFCSVLVQFANVSSQAIIPQYINLYNETPWSLKNKLQLTLSEEKANVVNTYYDLVGWQPDIVIYLYTLEHDHVSESIMDTDNVDGVKIFKLYADEPKLKENLLLIIDKILSYTDTNRLSNHQSQMVCG